MSDEDRKDFFHIGKMTEEFRKMKWQDIDPHLLKVWELRFQLAIAQQLSVISAHLNELIQSVHRSENR